MVDTDVETITYTIESPEGNTEELTAPAKIVDLLRETDDENDTEVLGDLAMLSLAQQAHALVHHSPEDPGDEIRANEQKALELFEERFGESFEEMTGHSH